jgi:hypothetical protein
MFPTIYAYISSKHSLHVFLPKFCIDFLFLPPKLHVSPISSFLVCLSQKYPMKSTIYAAPQSLYRYHIASNDKVTLKGSKQAIVVIYGSVIELHNAIPMSAFFQHDN